ncbi:MAG: hypothetical protein R2755_15845 [Acidimicrobiales bacterium]
MIEEIEEMDARINRGAAASTLDRPRRGGRGRRRRHRRGVGAAREDVRSVDTGPAPESPGPTSSTTGDADLDADASTTVRRPLRCPRSSRLQQRGATTVQTSIRPLYIAAGDGVVWVTSANGEVERLGGGRFLAGVTELRTVADDPAALAPTRPVLAFGSLWLQGRAGEVWRIDQASGAVRANIVVPGEVFSVANLFWHDLAVTADGVWVQRSSPAALLRIDPGTTGGGHHPAHR